jgi:hypothetical protein
MKRLHNNFHEFITLLELCTKLTKSNSIIHFRKFKTFFLPRFSFLQPIVARLGLAARAGATSSVAGRPSMTCPDVAWLFYKRDPQFSLNQPAVLRHYSYESRNSQINPGKTRILTRGPPSRQGAEEVGRRSTPAMEAGLMEERR